MAQESGNSAIFPFQLLQHGTALLF